MSKLAVVLIRGTVGANHDIKKTLESLKLHKKHVCAIIEDKPNLRGMLRVAQDYVTFGEVTDETIKALESKKHSENLYFLAPPVGGFERKGIKKSYSVGGALGDRKDAINALLVRMAN
jgi:large subunit ribosomal protein L30